MNQTFLSLSRTLHIYLTMLGLFVMLLFGITGFTANHEDWFGATQPRLAELKGQTPRELIEQGDTLRIVEHLRSSFHITGALSGYDVLDEHLSLGFKSPGQSWEVEIEKGTGETVINHESFNGVAVINNLHRGRYTGAAWSWVVDLSALLIVLACATGFILWLAIPRRHKLGIVAMLAGTAGAIMVVATLVPGGDVTPEANAQAAASADAPASEPVATIPDASPSGK